MNDYRVTVKVRNNRILKAIENFGGTPGQKWCDCYGLSYSKINGFINMAISPLAADGTLLCEAQKLCDVLGKLPDELWSNEQLYPLEKNFSELEMTHKQVVALLPCNQQSYLPDFSDFENRQTESLVSSALDTLTERERHVIKMRFYHEATYAECACDMGVSTERARQIEAKALRKLRHPARKFILADAVDFIDIPRGTRDGYKKAASELFGQKAVNC